MTVASRDWWPTSLPPTGGARRRGAAGRVAPAAAGFHAPVGLGAARAAAAHAERQARPRRAAAAARVAGAARAARPRADETETRLAGLWAAVLGAGATSVRTTTSSISAASRCWRCGCWRASRPEFGVTLTLRDLFEAPTVAGLAERIRAQPGALPAGAGAAAAAARGPAAVVLGPGAPVVPRPARSGEPGLQHRVDHRHSRRRSTLPRLQQALDRLVARHESLRTTFPSRDGRPVAGHRAGVARADRARNGR